MSHPGEAQSVIINELNISNHRQMIFFFIDCSSNSWQSENKENNLMGKYHNLKEEEKTDWVCFCPQSMVVVVLGLCYQL